MQIAFSIGVLSLIGIVLMCLDWGIPNVAERFGISLISYARNARRRQWQRARKQEQQLLQFFEREAA
jgi:hypothetical protein